MEKCAYEKDNGIYAHIASDPASLAFDNYKKAIDAYYKNGLKAAISAFFFPSLILKAEADVKQRGKELRDILPYGTLIRLLPEEGDDVIEGRIGRREGEYCLSDDLLIKIYRIPKDGMILTSDLFSPLTKYQSLEVVPSSQPARDRWQKKSGQKDVSKDKSASKSIDDVVGQ